MIDNAIKYSEDRAVVRIKATQLNQTKNISVSDQGIGIAPDKQPLVFERFYRVPHGNLHDVKGYGLGLFYVKSLMEKHGGNVNLQSIEGKGSTFTLTFTES